MPIFSPINATYGVRVEQILETDQDFVKYHDKLNRKLQKLRHRCQGVTKDTKKYSEKEKFSKITSDNYDKQSKLYGVLYLLQVERDLSLVETLKLRGRQRGKLKRPERKVIQTRLKKVAKLVEGLVALTQNEQNYVTRLQYLIYSKLAKAEFILNGKLTTKKKAESDVAGLLALAFAGLQYLAEHNYISEDISSFIQSKYEYSLMQYAGNLVSNVRLQNFIIESLKSIGDKDEIVKLLLNNGFKLDIKEVDDTTTNSLTNINWRSFQAKITDREVSHLIELAESVEISKLSDYSSKLLYWEDALSKQEAVIANYDENESTENADIDDPQENNQILLSYVKYNKLMVNILRDNEICKELWQQWDKSCSTLSAKVVKYKELERITSNLSVFLHEVMELPGIYSDDELMYQLELLDLHYKTLLSSKALAYLYQSRGKYREALALHVRSFQELNSKLEQDMLYSNDEILPNSLFDKLDIEKNQSNIKAAWTGVIALAGYQKSLETTGKSKYKLSVIEKISNQKEIEASDVNISNLFPLTPHMQPVGAKPTLFDLAFNYIQYEKFEQRNITENKPAEKQSSEPENHKEEQPKKRGFLGLFGR